MARSKTFQIRIDENCKNKLDKLKGNLSYNQYISYELLSNVDKLKKYKLVSKLLFKIDDRFFTFQWAFDELKEYVEANEIKQK
jgi:hypothetical protein